MRKRCVIYTRKSTDEGLDQSFNSLDAQREACAAFIKSQAHEGWALVLTHFDDGGFSGGSMDRPALQALLAEVSSRRIDIIVVYKIDRLTRSLLDFAKIVEILDAHDVSFVSVTQQFNTTTSMGRLMLNVLLSFAQFEREVTGERIRDKIAASKRKGMWMGGNPPLGYDVKERQLVINEAEAETVRRLFEAYRELGTVRRLKIWADSQGILTKRRSKGDASVGGKPFSRGNLYALLSNCLYKGAVSHRKQHYKGQHEAIIDTGLWEQVNLALRAKSAPRKSDTNNHSASLLAGRLFDETGDRLSPTYAAKGNKRYRYYVSRRLMTGEGDASGGWRLPANAIENAIAEAVRDFLIDRSRLSGEVGDPTSVHALNAVLTKAAGVAALQRESAGKEDLLSLVHRTVVHDDRFKITLDRSALLSLLGLKVDTENAEPISLDLPMQLQRRGVEAKLIIPSMVHNMSTYDANLVRTIAAPFAWFEEIVGGQLSSLQDLASREGFPASEVSRLLPLAFLSPAVIAAILEGRQPPQLTAERLKRLPGLPAAWTDQRISLGFNQEL
jgi:DNA invertase Pin-like site-specific DNA recombinase